MERENKVEKQDKRKRHVNRDLDKMREYDIDNFEGRRYHRFIF